MNSDLIPIFENIDNICEKNSIKILNSFRKNRVQESHFASSNGYGYGDNGRKVVNQVFADSFGAESALVSSNFASGTHSIYVSLSAILRPGDTILFVTGTPYDTLNKIINGNNCCSLKDFNISSIICDYRHDDLSYYLLDNPRIVYIQRSRGYSIKNSVDIRSIANLIKQAKDISPESIIVVDNCYGEFVEEIEPTQVGADLIIGSLIKNPGAGIAPCGGYISGRKDLVYLCEQRFLAPGLSDMGATHYNREILMGLFYSSLAVREALKTATFASFIFEKSGFEVYPRYDEKRTDIITSINLKSEQKLIKFCKLIQNYSPVDSFVVPEPWNMPGYNHRVIMASGGFISGSSIELSADAPVKEPFIVWLQGGTNFFISKMILNNIASSL